MPSISGMRMSIITRSGRAWRHSSTAARPLSASPTTSKSGLPWTQSDADRFTSGIELVDPSADVSAVLGQAVRRRSKG